MRRFLFVFLTLFVLAVPLVSAQTVLYGEPEWVKGYGTTWFYKTTPDQSRVVLITTTGLYVLNPSEPDAPALHLEGHTDSVRDVSFNADGSLMSSTSLDGTVRLWHLPDGAAVWSTQISAPCCDASAPSRTEFSEDGSLLLVYTGTQSPGGAFAINVRSGIAHPVMTSFYPPAVGLHRNQILSVVYGDESSSHTAIIQSLRTDGDGFALGPLAEIGGITPDPQRQGSATVLDHFAVVRGVDGRLTAYNIEEGTQQTYLEAPSLNTHQDTVYGPDSTRLKALDLVTGTMIELPFTRLMDAYDSEWVVYVDESGLMNALNLEILQNTPIGPESTRAYAVDGYVLYRDQETLKLFDPTIGEAHTLEGATAEDRPVNLFVADGRALAIYNQTSSLSSIGIWDAATGSNLVPPAIYGYFNTDSLAQDASRLAVSLMNLKTTQEGVLVADLSVPTLEFFPTEVSTSAKLLLGDKVFYQGQGFGLLDIATGGSTQIPKDEEQVHGQIFDLVFSPDGSKLAAGELDRVQIWDVATGKLSQTLPLDSPPRSLAFAEDGVVVLTKGSEMEFLSLSGSDTPIRAGQIGTSSSYYDMALYGRMIVVAGDQDVQVFSLGTDGQMTFERSLASDTSSQSPFIAVAIGEAYTAVARGTRSPSGEETSAATIIDLWDTATGAFVTRLEAPTRNDPYDLSFNADDTRLALTVGGMTIVWNTQALNEPLFTTAATFDSGSAFAGNTLARVEQSYLAHRIDLWDVDGDSLATLRRTVNSTGGGGGDGHKVTIAGSPNGSHLAALDPAGELVMWQVPDPVAVDSASVMAYCDTLDEPHPTPRADQPVTIVWSWFATEIPLVFDHLNAAFYDITLDGRPLAPWDVQRSVVRRDRANDDHWTVYYSLDVGTLQPGPHTITYRLTWRQGISDGLDTYGPDTQYPDNSGTCVFTVEDNE